MENKLCLEWSNVFQLPTLLSVVKDFIDDFSSVHNISYRQILTVLAQRGERGRVAWESCTTKYILNNVFKKSFPTKFTDILTKFYIRNIVLILLKSGYHCCVL